MKWYLFLFTSSSSKSLSEMSISRSRALSRRDSSAPRYNPPDDAVRREEWADSLSQTDAEQTPSSSTGRWTVCTASPRGIGFFGKAGVPDSLCQQHQNMEAAGQPKQSAVDWHLETCASPCKAIIFLTRCRLSRGKENIYTQAENQREEKIHVSMTYLLRCRYSMPWYRILWHRCSSWYHTQLHDSKQRDGYQLLVKR